MGWPNGKPQPLELRAHQSERAKKHGLSWTSEYKAWQQMRLRCLDPKHAAYPSNGGRGLLDDLGKTTANGGGA